MHEESSKTSVLYQLEKKQKKERGAIQIRKEVRISHLFTRPKFLCMIILQKVDF